MNTKNLKRGNPETQFHKGRGNGRGAVENGEKSGRSRRQKADIRAAAKDLLSLTTTATINGETKKVTQAYAVALNLLVKALDSDDKQCIEAAKTLIQLTGANRSEEETEMMKAQAELTRAKAQAINSGGAGIDIEDLQPLAEMLKHDENTDDTVETVLEEA